MLVLPTPFFPRSALTPLLKSILVERHDLKFLISSDLSMGILPAGPRRGCDLRRNEYFEFTRWSAFLVSALQVVVVDRYGTFSSSAQPLAWLIPPC